MNNELINASRLTPDGSYYQAQARMLQDELNDCQSQLDGQITKVKLYQIENTSLREHLKLLKTFSDSLWDRLQLKEWI